MENRNSLEPAEDHDAQRSDCGPPQQIKQCFSLERNSDSIEWNDSSSNANDLPNEFINDSLSKDINNTSNTDTNDPPNEYINESLNKDTNDNSNTDTNDSVDEDTNDTPFKTTIAIWGQTSQLYSRLHDLHSALSLYKEFDDICPDNPPLWRYFHIHFLDQITLIYLVVGFLKLNNQSAGFGYIIQTAENLVHVNMEVVKEPPQSLALGQERGAVRTRVERCLDVFPQDWRRRARAELAEMRAALMQQVLDKGKVGVPF